MINIGGNIGEAYVGSTKIAEAYVGNQLVYSSSPEVLPYDAEIEYLESNGTQYIDTGYYPTKNTKIRVKGRYTYSPIDANNAQHYLFGVRDKTSNTYFAFLMNYYKSGSSYYYPNYANIGDKSTNVSLNYANIDIIVWLSRTGCYVTNKSTSKEKTIMNSSVAGASKNFTLTYSLYLLWCNISDNSESQRTPYGRLYSCQIYESDILQMDLIPVRVGTVGYMYDKVSKQMFGNSGTGNFTLGNDVV